MEKSDNNKTFQIDFRNLSILMLIAAIPMLIGTWWLFSSFEQESLASAGERLGDTAETAFAAVNSHLENQIFAIAGLTEVAALRDAVSRGNQDLHKNLVEVRKSIPKMVTLWAKLSREAPQVQEITDNAASRYLRRYAGVNRNYRQVIVTDYLGRLVASTNRSVPYYYALDDWWKQTYADGIKGAIFIGNVHYDADSRSFLMDIALPILDPNSGVTGIIKGVLDTRGIYELLGSVRAGAGTAVFLTLEKGDVITGPGYSNQRQITFPGAQEILLAREKGKRYVMPAGTPQILYGLTQKGFPQIYPYLNWDVVSRAEAKDLLGPLPRLRLYCMALIAGAILAAVVAALMLSSVESRPVIEEDPHLERI